MRIVATLLLFLAAQIFLANDAFAQTASPSPTPRRTAIENDRPPAPAPKPTQTPATSGVKRWLEFDALSLATRYRYIDTRAGHTVNNQQQYQVAVRGRFKFDRRGKYSVYGVLMTGNSITGGWNNTGIGTGDWQSNLFPKQLYFDAKPVKSFEFQVGGLGINNGENTEITGYDNDVYITGGRLLFRKPKKVYFNEVSITFAHLGEFNRPSIFRRLQHIDNLNYHQFLVRKQVNKRVSFSADYTFEMGRDFLHEAVKVKTPELRVFDNMLVESYQRVDKVRGAGFNVAGEKTLFKKLTISGGFAHIDRPLLNSDRFPQGNRIYEISTYKIIPEFSIGTALIHGVSGLPTPQTHRTRFELIFTYNVLETLRRHKVL